MVIKNTSKIGSLVVVVTLVCFVAAHQIFFCSSYNSLNAISSYCVYPVVQATAYVVSPIKKFLNHRQTVQELEGLLAEIQEENRELIAQNIDLNSSLNYAADVKELVDFKKRYDITQATAAHIILKNISEQEHSFLVDCGAHHGIQKIWLLFTKIACLGK